MAAMRKAISQQRATDMISLTIQLLRCQRSGQLSATLLESTLVTDVVVTQDSMVLLAGS